MIQNSFRKIFEDMKGLINEDIWSVPLSDASDFLSDSCVGPDVLLAVSGGMDSMCLADLCCRTYGAGAFAVAHCNFHLRGNESDEDEELVRNWSADRGVRFHHVDFDTSAYAENNGVSIEMAARELRYRWFSRLCVENGYRAVVVAHHADDNAETLILNLVRGTGIKGITGMSQVSDLPYSSEYVAGGVRLFRPLLGFTRKQIEGYVLGMKVPYRNDSTNQSVEYTRNRIRHEVFPVLRKINPSFLKTLNREMSYFSDASEIVGQWCAEASGLVACNEGERLVVDIEKLMSYRQWRYLLYYVLEPFGFNSTVLASVEALLLSDRTFSGKMFRSETHVLTTGRSVMYVCRKPVDAVEDAYVEVEGAGLYRCADVNVSVEVCPWNAGMTLKQPQGTLIFDAAKLTFPFVLRKWQRGDWMKPLGMKGRKKLSDMFADLKYDVIQKQAAVVVSDEGYCEGGNRVAALLGVRMDGSYKVDEDTEMIIRITKHIDD